MNWGGSDAFVLLLAAALVVAAIGDIRSRTISNRLNLAMALGAIPFWYFSDLALWPDVAIRVAVAAGLFAIFAGAFALGMMGGGDVKLLGALALWLPPAAVLFLVVLMSLGGGVLTLFLWVRHKVKRRTEPLEIPYGVAIAFGGLWLISERILNQFG